MLKNRLLLCLSAGAMLIAGIGATIPEHAAAADHPGLERGRSRMAKGDWDGAINVLGDAINADRHDTRARLMRATCYLKLGNYKLAVQDADQALQVAPNNVRAYLLRGSAHAKLGQDDDAVSDYQSAIKIDNSLAVRYFTNGGPAEVRRDTTGGAHKDLNLHGVNDYQKAMNNLYPNGLSTADKAKVGAPEMVEVTSSGTTRSVGLTDEGKAGTTTISTTTNSDSGSGRLNSNDNYTIAGAGEFKGDAKKAVADLTEVLRGNQNSAEIYYKRGKALQKLGRVDDALKDYASAIERDPQKSQYYIGRASVFYQLGKTSLCDNEIVRARSVDPDVPANVHFDLPKYPAKVKWSGGDGPSNP